MIDMKYKVYCISAMMLCCVVSKAQEKDTVEVGAVSYTHLRAHET